MSKNRQKQGEHNPQKHESCARGCGASRDSLRHPPFATLSVDFIEQILGISRGLASEIRQCSFEIMHKNYKTQIKLLVEAVKLANKRKKRGVAVQKFIMAPFPHARGDDPGYVLPGLAKMYFSPRPWG